MNQDPRFASQPVSEGHPDKLADPVITHLDPWLKQTVDDAPMDTAVFIGQYQLPIEGKFEITEAVFLSGGALNWQLWTLHGGPAIATLLARRAAGGPGWRELAKDRGLAVAATLQATPMEAATVLLRALLRGHYPYTGATEPFVGGLLSTATLGRIAAELEAEWDRNRQEAIAEALRNPPPIVISARELRLSPRPAGQNGTSWVANCPSGRGHSIMISSASNTFGCGYCREKGGTVELVKIHQAFHQAHP